MGERSGTVFRHRDDVAATVGGVGFSAGESARDEVVERGDHVASIDPRVPSEIRLTGGAVLLERGEQTEVVAADTFGGERVSSADDATGRWRD